MTESEMRQEDAIPFYPDHVRTEAKVALVFVGLAFLIGAIAMWYPVGQGVPADPMNTPAHTKPEWYFLFLYELLKYVPKTLGVLLPIAGVALLFIWPFLDSRADSKKARRNRIILAGVVLVAVIGLTLLGEFN